MAYVGEIWDAVLAFNSALALFNFCNDQAPRYFAQDQKLLQQLNNWKLIAARDGIWSIYNLGETIQYANPNVIKLPAFNTWVDYDKLRLARRKFRAWFPDYISIRHALGHISETTKNTQERDKNYYKGPFKSNGMIVPGNDTMIMIKNSLNGNSFQTTFKGRLLSYEISEQTLKKLVMVKDEFFSGFSFP